MRKVRVRFAPSPTGGLHLGGMRTALYNYLFAKQQLGDFILRIEDTDQSRYVEAAENYIIECLKWCNITPDEGPHAEGDFSPYRQSERKSLYNKYATQLIESGHAYYAFDTPEEIESMRERLKQQGKSSLHYDHHVRGNMRNSLNLSPSETNELLQKNTPYVIRIKIDPGEMVELQDIIRGPMHFDTSSLDDKVLMKADGMPTYHLAVVVDDYLMKISHAFRGEEWLPSAPVHVLLWRHLGLESHMPQWAHLPLILKPDGNGKLSKRDGDRLGFPVFAMNWQDPATGELVKGFKELGFLPEAFLNFLALLGWNDGSAQEIFTLDELVAKFSIHRVHHAGAKFDFEKAKWFNHEWIKKLTANQLLSEAEKIFKENGITTTTDKLEKVVSLIKDRCILLNDFWEQGRFFFEAPVKIDTSAIQPSWNEKKQLFFAELIRAFELDISWDHHEIEKQFKELAAANQLKPGELMLPLRIMLVGGKYGPGVFDIAGVIGQDETIQRIKYTIGLLK